MPSEAPAVVPVAEATREAPTTDALAVSAWDADVGAALAKFVAASAAIGSLVAEQAAEVQAAFGHTRDIVQTAAVCQLPADGMASPAVAPLLQPLQGSMQRTVELREKNRGEKALFNHLSTVSEGIPALGWIAVEKPPAPYIADMKESAEFYANRVIKEHKDG